MENRLKIKVQLSKLDKSLELGGNVLLLSMWGLTAYTFLKLPHTIPIHFNASGHPDDYGDKTTLLVLPALASIIYFGLTQLNKRPHIFNYMAKITEENVQQQYAIPTRMLRFLKIAILINFTLIILFTYLTTLGITNGPGNWFLPITFALLVIPTVIIAGQKLKKKNNA